MKVDFLGFFWRKRDVQHLNIQPPSDPWKILHTQNTSGTSCVSISLELVFKRYHKWEILKIFNSVLATWKVLKLKIPHWLQVCSQEQCPVHNDHKNATLGVTAHISFVLICPWLLREKSTPIFCVITHLRRDYLLQQDNSSHAKTSTSKASWREPTAHAIKCVYNISKIHVLLFSMWK